MVFFTTYEVRNILIPLNNYIMRKVATAFALLGLLIFQACEGPMGPNGPQGPQGEPGVNIVSEVFEVELDFTPQNNYSEQFNIDPVIQPGDMIAAFIEWEQDNGTSVWRALPQTEFFNEGALVYNYDFTRGDFRLFLDGSVDKSLLGTAYTHNQFFRVMIIPGDITGRMDLSDYDAVASYLGVTDADFQKVKLN